MNDQKAREAVVIGYLKLKCKEAGGRHLTDAEEREFETLAGQLTLLTPVEVLGTVASPVHRNIIRAYL